MSLKKKKLALHWKIIIGLALGILWAYISILLNYIEVVDEYGNVISTHGINSVKFTQDWISPFGDIFIRCLKFIAIPLVLFSIITGVSSLKDISKLGRVGAKTLGTYLITTLFAVSVGLILVNLLQPGNAISHEQKVKNRIQYELWVEANPDIDFKDDKRYYLDEKYSSFVNEIKSDSTSMVDANVSNMKENALKKKEESPLQSLVDMVPENIIDAMLDSKKMLQVIFFAIFFGICLILIPEEKAKPVKRFFEGVNEVFLKMVDIIMKASPYFVFALMAGVLSKMANSVYELQNLITSLGAYSGVVILGLIFMILLYPFLVSVFVKKIKFMEFWRKISPAQLMAFSTSSSAATLPVTLECVEENVGVKPEVASFVLPIGATVNMDGTSLYQAVAVIFLAQIHLIDLTLAEQGIIVLTATLASIGSAAVPSAGLVMLMIVLSSVGLNPVWIAIILPVDRILDMCRTVVNVTGDASVATIIASSENAIEYKDNIK